MLSNEDWHAYKTLFVDELKATKHYFTAAPDQIGAEDALLRRTDKVPNLKGAEALGLKSSSFDELAKNIESGKIKTLYVIERDLTKVFGDRAAALLSKAGTTILQGPNKYALGDAFTYRLPATAYVEEDGHFTNFEGKIGAYQKALAPIGDARPDWDIFALLQKALAGAKKEKIAA
jgi:predicted molibdopterin-dependent oxidoreductase YjgC